MFFYFDILTWWPTLNLGSSLLFILSKPIYVLDFTSTDLILVDFILVVMVSFRSAQMLSSYLVRAKLYPLDYLVRAKLYPLERKVGSSKCGKRRCEVCNNVTDASTFSSTVTGDTFKINHSLNCDDKCLIYLMTCKHCNNQYTGETKDLLGNR